MSTVKMASCERVPSELMVKHASKIDVIYSFFLGHKVQVYFISSKGFLYAVKLYLLVVLLVNILYIYKGNNYTSSRLLIKRHIKQVSLFYDNLV